MVGREQVDREITRCPHKETSQRMEAVADVLLNRNASLSPDHSCWLTHSAQHVSPGETDCKGSSMRRWKFPLFGITSQGGEKEMVYSSSPTLCVTL